MEYEIKVNDIQTLPVLHLLTLKQNAWSFRKWRIWRIWNNLNIMIKTSLTAIHKRFNKYYISPIMSLHLVIRFDKSECTDFKQHSKDQFITKPKCKWKSWPKTYKLYNTVSLLILSIDGVRGHFVIHLHTEDVIAFWVKVLFASLQHGTIQCFIQTG